MPLIATNPFNQETICTLDYDDQQIETKLSQLEKTFRTWRHTPLNQRIERVRDALAYFQTNREKIAVEISLQMGKPIAQSNNELNGFFERAEYMLSIAPEALAPDVLPEKPGIHRRIEHEPLGIVFNIAAWNYPLLIPVNVIVPALLAGNVVLLKHSAKTPLCGEHFAKAFGDLVSNINLTHDMTKSVIADKRIAHVAFTGSVDGGHHIYQAVADRFIDVGLELGGKDPAYIAADADLNTVVEQIVDGACYNAGQSCCGIERVYVHHTLYDEFLARAETIMTNYQLGDPLLETTTMGPLASRAALNFLDQQVDDAKQQGADILVGGEQLKETLGNFYQPTLLANVPNHALVMQEESFAPFLPVCRVKNDEEALTRMNNSSLGLTASVWTKDLERAEHFAKHLEAGTIFQNRCDYLDPALPWTGYKDSGKGSTLSRYGFLNLTRPKSIHFRY